MNLFCIHYSISALNCLWLFSQAVYLRDKPIKINHYINHSEACCMQKHCSRKNDKVYLKESESTLFGIISSVPAIICIFSKSIYLEKEMVTLVYQQKHFLN